MCNIFIMCPRACVTFSLSVGPFRAGAEHSDSEDVPLRDIAVAALATLGQHTAGNNNGGTPGESEVQESSEGISSASSEGGGPAARGGVRGRGRGRGRARGRGRNRAYGGDRNAEPPPLGQVDIEREDESSTSEKEDVEEDVGEIELEVGGVVWFKNQGRVVDPMATFGYQRPPLYKLHGFTTKNELEFFQSFFPVNLINETAACMTTNGRRLGYGTHWEVTPGMLWLFFGYNMAILTLHTAGPKEDLWLSEVTNTYRDSLWLPPGLGRFGMDWSMFKKMMRAFCLPTYGTDTDPFNPIRRFLDEWNSRMASTLAPGPVICVDESMGLWVGRRNKDGTMQSDGMPGWQFVGRKPTNMGRELFTTACCDTGIIIFAQLHEGATRMAQKEFVAEWGKNPSKAMRCVKPWFGSGRLVILDSGFASFKCAHGLAENGLFTIGNVKTASAKFPKDWLLDQVPERGNRGCASTNITLKSGATWSVVGVADRDKQPMTLIATAGTTTMGEPMVRHYPIMRADGSTEVREYIFEHWHIHALYRNNFNALDMHNAKRQGGTSFEDTWKTHRWWLRDFQMLFGMSEVNAYLAWKRFKPDMGSCSPNMFRRRLAHQMLHHPITMLERGERASLRAKVTILEHYLVETPMMSSGQRRRERRACRFCGKKTQWTCVCSPWADDIEEEGMGDVMFICSPTQNPNCFGMHGRGEEPTNKRSLALVKAWKVRKANKTAQGPGRLANAA